MLRAVTIMKEDSLVITTRSFKTMWRADSWCHRFSVACLFCGVAAFLMPLPASAANIDVNALLTGPGFNSGDPALGLFTTTPQNLWLQEAAALVVGSENGVSPNEGDGMLRIQETGLTASQVRQVVNVSFTAGDDASFQMVFNSPSTSSLGVLSLSAYGTGTVGVSALLLGSITTGSTAIDGDPLTWETLSATLLLPVGTTQLEVQVAFINGTIPQNGYVDAVPEPSTLLLATLGLFGLALWNRRKRA